MKCRWLVPLLMLLIGTLYAQELNRTYPAQESSNIFTGSNTFTHPIQAPEAITIWDPRYYGAKCDWNGTTGTDDTAALLNAIKAIGGGLLRFPPNKRCKITSSLYLLAPTNTGMHIVADPTLTLSDHGASGIVADPAAASPFIPLVLAAGEATLEGLTIDGYSSTSGKASAGILCWNCGRSKFDQTTVTNVAGDGYLISDSYYIATSSTTVSPGNSQTITLTGVPFPLTTATSLTVSLEPGTTNSENRTPTSVGTFASGTQTVTINITKRHTAPYRVALMGGNNAITFYRSFATNNAGWGYRMALDYQDAQNDAHFDKVFAMFNGTGGNGGGLLVEGGYENGEITGGTYTSNTGYPVQFGVSSSTTGPKSWRISGPDDVESNTHNCIYEARALSNTYLSGWDHYLCPPTLTQTIQSPTSSTSFGSTTQGPRLGPTPRGDFIQIELNSNFNRGLAMWPGNVNNSGKNGTPPYDATPPTWPPLSVSGGVIRTGVVAPTNGGANWLRTPTCSITDSTGRGATCTVIVDSGASLTVTSVNITNGGSGYTSPTIALTGGQDMALSLHSRGAQPIRLNMPISGFTAIAGGTGGVMFGPGGQSASNSPVARIDNAGCLTYSERNSEAQYGKLCQTFRGRNTYTMPDTTGNNTYSMVGLKAGDARPKIAGTDTQVALYSDVNTAPRTVAGHRSYCGFSYCTIGLLTDNARLVTLFTTPSGNYHQYIAQCAWTLITPASGGSPTSSTVPVGIIGYTDAISGATNTYVSTNSIYTGNTANHITAGNSWVFNAAPSTNVTLSTSGYTSNPANLMSYGGGCTVLDLGPMQ